MKVHLVPQSAGRVYDTNHSGLDTLLNKIYFVELKLQALQKPSQSSLWQSQREGVSCMASLRLLETHVGGIAHRSTRT